MLFLRPFLLLLLLASPALAQDRPAIEAQFRAWLNTTIWPRAQAQNVPRATFDAAFAGVTLQWDLPDLVPPGTTAPTRTNGQSEFGNPARYFSRNNVDWAVTKGREMANRYQSALNASARTGVPPHITLAIWGRESAYGQANIPHDAFAVLGTKGFMSTRAPYFTDELVAALRIAAAGHRDPKSMKSSWAGALGQPQFMPSNFLKYATDGDGDARADIWRSAPDTIASIARYLAQHGWEKGRDWGFEVTVPAAVSCALEGPDQARKISDWVAMGITRSNGRAFPDHELAASGSLMMPAGRNGPAFIVTPNFYVLKAYNNSDLYALYVGHIGDRIAYNVGGFTAGWGAVDRLLRADIAAMQRGLVTQGHDVGGVDGFAGFKTRRSIGRWQQAAGLAATCFPSRRVVQALGD